MDKQPINSIITLYHGSDHIIQTPQFGFGKTYNDYGLGFYTTRDAELAREWSSSLDKQTGFVNEYLLDFSLLDVLDLTSNKYNVLNWISILIENRTFALKNPIAVQGKTFLLDNYLPQYKNSDVIIGWRADDSYFRYAEDFLNNTLGVNALSKAILLGNLGLQYVIKSKRAFNSIKFVNSQEVKIEYIIQNGKEEKNKQNWIIKTYLLIVEILQTINT